MRYWRTRVDIVRRMSDSPEFTSFVGSLAGENPSTAIAPELQALWWVRRNDWNRAHVIVQDLESRAAARVHAHLHRVEGDLDNANYWYRRAGVVAIDAPLEEEWSTLTKDLLSQASADSVLR